jgi:hypothetical protein
MQTGWYKKGMVNRKWEDESTCKMVKETCTA